MGKSQEEKAKEKQLELLANTEFGQKAHVDRHDVLSEKGDIQNRILRDIGKALNPLPDTVRYMGSACVHIYKSPLLEQIFYVDQCCLGSLKEVEAAKAFENLRGTMQEFYHGEGTRQKRRSGF